MRAQQQGFALVAAIILVVILAGLAAFVASLVSGQSANQRLERMTRVVDLAARAGLEWGAYQVMRPTPSVCIPNTLFPPGTLLGGLGSVSVTVSCRAPPGLTTYLITATATFGGAPNNPDYVERQKTAVFFRP